MKTIVHATDYSKNSIAALKYAYDLTTQLGTRLVITHVFDYPTVLGSEVLSEPFPHLEKGAFKMHRSKLEKFCAEHLGNKWGTPNIQLEVVENKSVIKGIISKAEKWHAYMIIVGMKGGSGLREMIMGSITKQLIEKALCPVLAIPEDLSHRQIEIIVYATDFEDEDINAIHTLTEIARAFGAEIRIVHISPLKEFHRKNRMNDFEEQTKKIISYSKMEFDIIPSDDTFEDLRLYLGNVNADLIVMLERKSKGLLKKLFHRDLVKEMESYGKVPLMSFNETNY